MDSLLSSLECEVPENRVLEWLKQCSAAPKYIEYCRVDSRGNESENGSNGFELTPNINHWKKDALKVHLMRRQSDSSSPIRNKHLKSKHPRSSETDSGCLTSSSALRGYTQHENQRILKYIVENDAFPFLKGTLLWQKMEKDKICCRSWQSMKTQFIKKIFPKIGDYSLKSEDEEKFMEHMKPSPHQKLVHMKPGKRGWRKNGRYYTIEEDLIILKYISHSRRHLEVHGNSMWQRMEDKEILPGRTWQSMRSRYLKIIRHSLDEYKLKDSSIETMMNSRKNGLSFKKKLNVDVSPFPCRNITNLARKAANQDIRKYAISTGAQLASKLKLFGKATEYVRKPDQEVQRTNCPSLHHNFPETPLFDKHSTSEKNDKNNDENAKEIECSVSCKVSKIIPDLRKDDALTNVPVDQSDNATEKFNRSDKSIVSSAGSGINSQECDSLPDVSQNRNLKEMKTFVKNHSTSRNSENNFNEDRNIVECAVPGLVSDLQDPVDSVNVINDLGTTAHTENHSDSEVNVTDIESQSGLSVCGDCICFRKTRMPNTSDLLGVHSAVENCAKCSSDHKLSPSSN